MCLHCTHLSASSDIWFMLRQTEDMQNHNLNFRTSTESSDYAYYAMILIIDKMIVCHFDSNLSRLQLTITTGVFWNKPLQGMAPPVHKLKVLYLNHPLMHSLSSLLFQPLTSIKLLGPFVTPTSNMTLNFTTMIVWRVQGVPKVRF